MTHRPLVKARQGWRIWVDSDRGLAALLLFLVAYGFFIYPLACAKETTNPLAASAFSVVLVLGVLATTRHKGMRMGMVILAVLAFTSRWLHLLIQAHAVHVIAASASILFFSVLSSLVIQSVFRGGGITIANAPGTGIADDKAIYSFMPEIVEFYTGEKPILQNVPTWRCRN